MAGTGTIAIGGLIDGLASGNKNIDLSFDITTAVDQSLSISLASGDNTFTPPTGVNAVMIIPPPANVTVIKLKGAAGDTGIVLNPSKPSFIGLGGAANIIINAAAIIAGVVISYV